MNIARRQLLTGLLAGTTILSGCGNTPRQPTASAQERAAIAPTGKLRVGIYEGSPTSLVTDRAGNRTGVAHDLGRELAQRLDVPFEPIVFRSVPNIVEALMKNEIDFTFTIATPARVRDLSMTKPLVHLEMGYLVPANSPLRTAAEMDRVGVKVGVAQGGAAQGTLSSLYKQASVVPVPTLKAAAEHLSQGKLDAFTANKGILFQLSDELPGSRVLDGRWGLENLAIAIPKGRDAGLPYLNQFATSVQREGVLAQIIQRAGLRGTGQP